MDNKSKRVKTVDKVINKPIEVSMEELRVKILTSCADAKMNLYFIDSVLESVYKEVHEQYILNLNNRTKEYYDSLKDDNETQKEAENKNGKEGE